ncbi:MAG: T9SS type A sorting domain-containing protein [Sphingobacteriales bacterium]|nr:MAG: T9SS type A sorting domain-containing protein [Sphingobacteriales bacterium]
MNKALLRKLLTAVALLMVSVCSYGQTAINTIATAPTSTTSPGVVTFAVRNTNSFPVAVTQIAGFHNIINNGRTYTIWYHPTALTGAPSITVANGWTQFGISPVISGTASGVTTLVTNKYLVIPGNTTYRFAVTINSGSMYYGTSATNTWSGAGVDVLTGNNVVSPGYAGTFPSPTASSTAAFAGTVTVETAAADNLMATTVVQPLNNAQFCSDAPTLVRAVVRNVGSNPQSNFPVSAVYTTSTTTNTVTGVYPGTLLPFTSDTVVIGTIMPAPGVYSMRAYTQLSTDPVFINDTTTGSVNFTYKAVVPAPITASDTVCSGGNAYVVIITQPSTTYYWYSDQTGGTLMNISNNLQFPNLTQDTTLYVASNFNGCQSVRSPIHAVVGPQPVLNLPADTGFCESIPLILDAGNPGGTYLWSTGDTTQTITITNVSGTYWVVVDKYCTNADTSNVTIAPQPYVSGISYIAQGNTFYFNPSTVQNVDSYYWIFGDGNVSSDSNAVHTYAAPHPAYEVVLVVQNDCGTDTVRRTIPLLVNDPSLFASVDVYPNPSSENVTVSSPASPIESVRILNSVGALVENRQCNQALSCSLNIRSMAPGNYFLYITTEGGTVTKPLQIRR